MSDFPCTNYFTSQDSNVTSSSTLHCTKSLALGVAWSWYPAPAWLTIIRIGGSYHLNNYRRKFSSARFCWRTSFVMVHNCTCTLHTPLARLYATWMSLYNSVQTVYLLYIEKMKSKPEAKSKSQSNPIRERVIWAWVITKILWVTHAPRPTKIWD